ncbi:MAG TPA: 4-hydroxy-tetrahydrodipicolinate reductase, partial [Xanthobacteraceae bacterium]|nr:4-hydroxy-tetrahydrodipicolinate reductase [Xanthobacteraceae bacterium]
MADMRLVILGAGGRMGRTLVKTIADTAGATVVGG